MLKIRVYDQRESSVYDYAVFVHCILMVLFKFLKIVKLFI